MIGEFKGISFPINGSAISQKSFLTIFAINIKKANNIFITAHKVTIFRRDDV